MQPDKTEPPLRFRKLRIAWSVFWGLACVLLILFWVRSYWRIDNIRFPILQTNLVGAWSIQGTIAVYHAMYQPGFFNRRWFMKDDDEVNQETIATTLDMIAGITFVVQTYNY